MAVTVGRLMRVKRLDRFIRALALARRRMPEIRGIIIGDGPERIALEELAISVGLGKHDLLFLGHCNDVPALLKQADMLVLTSDSEGFPNAVLEAMAAGLPVITTPAGDAELLVQDGTTGYIVPFDDLEMMADRIVRLAESTEVAQRLGRAGRERVKRLYSVTGLAEELLEIYRQVAVQVHNQRVLDVIPPQHNLAEQRVDVQCET